LGWSIQTNFLLPEKKNEKKYRKNQSFHFLIIINFTTKTQSLKETK